MFSCDLCEEQSRIGTLVGSNLLILNDIISPFIVTFVLKG